MPKKKEQKTISTDLEIIFNLIEEVIIDRSIPKNIRSAVEKAKEIISHKLNPADIDSAIYELDDISSDINMPFHARSEIWNIINALEALREKIK